MTGERDPGRALDERTERALAALLAIPAPDAAEIRERTPARRRPRRQYGPRLDLGGEDVDGPDGAAGGDGSPAPGPAVT